MATTTGKVRIDEIIPPPMWAYDPSIEATVVAVAARSGTESIVLTMDEETAHALGHWLLGN